MIREQHFHFKDLIIDRGEIETVLGFTPGAMPEPFPEYLDKVYEFSNALKDIRSCYVIMDDFQMTSNNDLVIANTPFPTGKAIIKELSGSQKLALFICTAGAEISNKSKELMDGEDPVLGYVYDTMGSFIAEAAGDQMQKNIQAEVETENMTLTNRYSPGYCNWSVQDQHKLFSLFNGNTIGVQLTDSALMHPVKSISGVIGLGENVKFREYRCALCTSKNCTLRSLKK